MRDQHLQLLKEGSIKADYAKWVAKRKYTKEYILDKLSAKFHLKPSTIDRIVWGEYDTNRQRAALRRSSLPPGVSSQPQMAMAT